MWFERLWGYLFGDLYYAQKLRRQKVLVEAAFFQACEEALGQGLVPFEAHASVHIMESIFGSTKIDGNRYIKRIHIYDGDFGIIPFEASRRKGIRLYCTR